LGSKCVVLDAHVQGAQSNVEIETRPRHPGQVATLCGPIYGAGAKAPQPTPLGECYGSIQLGSALLRVLSQLGNRRLHDTTGHAFAHQSRLDGAGRQASFAPRAHQVSRQSSVVNQSGSLESLHQRDNMPLGGCNLL
jgi:hypothetical protein